MDRKTNYKIRYYFKPKNVGKTHATRNGNGKNVLMNNINDFTHEKFFVYEICIKKSNYRKS